VPIDADEVSVLKKNLVQTQFGESFLHPNCWHHFLLLPPYLETDPWINRRDCRGGQSLEPRQCGSPAPLADLLEGQPGPWPPQQNEKLSIISGILQSRNGSLNPKTLYIGLPLNCSTGTSLHLRRSVWAVPTSILFLCLRVCPTPPFHIFYSLLVYLIS
jgi:hypothetical protein